MITDQLEQDQTYTLQNFGNGTTALYAALQAAECSGSYVAVPATVCPNVVAAIFATSNLPFFVDIEFDRFGIDPGKLEGVLPQVRAVVAVHAFGIPCHIQEISDVCTRYAVPLIEDCAQAEGAVYQGKEVGTFGDVAIFSYGAGKIIDAGGGGCTLTRNPVLGRCIRGTHGELPNASDAAASQELSLFYKFFYNHLYPDRLSPYQSVFTILIKQFGSRLLARHDGAFDRAITEGKRDLANNIRCRIEKAELYKRLLGGHKHIRLLEAPSGSVPWRFNIWVAPKARHWALRRMLAEGFKISSWYPDISRFLDRASYRATPLENSDWLEKGVLNFWLDDETTEKQVTATSERLLELLHECSD